MGIASCTCTRDNLKCISSTVDSNQAEFGWGLNPANYLRARVKYLRGQGVLIKDGHARAKNTIKM